MIPPFHAQEMVDHKFQSGAYDADWYLVAPTVSDEFVKVGPEPGHALHFRDKDHFGSSDHHALFLDDILETELAAFILGVVLLPVTVGVFLEDIGECVCEGD